MGSVQLSGAPGTVIPAGFELSVVRPSGGSPTQLVTADPVVIPPAGSVDGVRVQKTPPFGEEIVARTLRHNGTRENFRANYGWYNGSPTGRLPLPPAVQHHTPPHTDRTDVLPIRRVTFPSIRRVTSPLFEIASNPTINLSAIRDRRFSLTDRDIEPLPSVDRIMRGLAKTFGRSPPVPPPLPPELPRRSRYERLVA